MNNLDVLSGFAGAFVMLLLGSVGFLVNHGRTGSRIEANERRLTAIENDLAQIIHLLQEVREEVAFLGGATGQRRVTLHKPVAHS